jgi:hypothetical protein
LLVDQVERYYWWERLTEAHYNRAAAFLRSLDEIWCVKDGAYAGGELWVHTPYCDAAVVRDVCDHFGFQIRWFSYVARRMLTEQPWTDGNGTIEDVRRIVREFYDEAGREQPEYFPADEPAENPRNSLNGSGTPSTTY